VSSLVAASWAECCSAFGRVGGDFVAIELGQRATEAAGPSSSQFEWRGPQSGATLLTMWPPPGPLLPFSTPTFSRRRRHQGAHSVPIDGNLLAPGPLEPVAPPASSAARRHHLPVPWSASQGNCSSSSVSAEAVVIFNGSLCNTIVPTWLL